MRTYELYTGSELEVAELIQQRRYQILIHSCIYYELDQNIISDRQWDMWAKELVDLQKQYPEISKTVALYEYFKTWDASTGAFLPIKETWVIQKAQQIFGVKKKKQKEEIKYVNKPEKKVQKKKRLF